MNVGLVLDATASSKRNWPEKADVRLDISKDARPDVRGTATALPFKNGAFSEVYCDPPHMIAFQGDVRWKSDWEKKLPKGFQRFSYWPDKDAWWEFLHASALEFHRVLEPNGLLHYKVPDGSRSHGRMIDAWDVHRLTAFGFACIEDVTKETDSVLSRVNRKRGRSGTIVHYLTFRRVSKSG